MWPAVLLALVQSAAEPTVDLAAELEAFRKGTVDPAAYDYGRIRFHEDGVAAWAAMDALEQLAGERSQVPPEHRDGRGFSGCLLGTESYAIVGGVRVAKLAPDRESYARARAYALDVVARTEAALTRRLVEIEAADSDARLRALRAHHARDAAWRGALFAWEPGAPAHVREVVMAAVYPRLCDTDSASAAFMREAVDDIGWFTIGEHGAEADRMAFLLVQHADHDPDLQREVLARLETLLAEGETTPLHYAMLFDRTAVNSGRPQRYGSQGRCMGPSWTPVEIEDPDGVDARRDALGLTPLEDLVAQHSGRCR
ncbi:MAG: hypothetical protein KIS81_04610 [Maricaulaceae bacterium]|nr:hypothetical protein [Maricaulaceae bacterium]